MGLFLPLLGAFALAVILVYLFARPKGPDAGRRLLKRAAAGTLLAIGAVLTLTGKMVAGVPLIAFGLYLWRPAILEPGPVIADGAVKAGRFAGRSLDSLSRDELVQLYLGLASRPRDRAILEAHLDRRIPGWREHFQRDAAGGARRAPGSGAMTDEQAYQILGLAPGAAEAEIQAAYRRLMMRVHPDQGGSTFLAAQINEAKERLLGRHR
ncbi:molecular chaperone DnaJ [Kaistia algarum]|uniref:DnaJ domain-containing protein n=1 Tax=Kaistia algarum TaxID=2083279 RepID=UPI000CE870FB|nr:DnaJ domain-containing protein [Kaistia algarum]MCX5515248.1 DnaJ domain-containing protein [Kaistia algarum]PPE79956.1 molecular chaperone DnaJ [Kaistia algarum]